MIKSITLTNFKKYKDKTINLKDGVTLLVGGNNEGKSTILHALAVWEFCKNYLEHMRGKNALCRGYAGSGVGMNIDDFSPVNIPEYKYLWTNLKPSSGYNLKIKCCWDTENKFNRSLEIGLALSNERLFIKVTSTNIEEDTYIPNIAYLPPFAGISDKESWHYPAERKRLIGRGLAGAVLRNTIIDMYNENQERRKKLKGDKPKIAPKDPSLHRQTDPFEQLNTVIFDVFKCQLAPKPFDISFHNYVRTDIVRGEMHGGRFKSYGNFKSRDIMVEGSGFLQWLSVYTFALDKNIDILLLDEPDAHLHCSLQTTLISKLVTIAHHNKKQILIATHSVEIVKNMSFDQIMDVNKTQCKYLTTPDQRIRLLSGLGTEYSPIINDAQKTKNILFVENESDATFLKIFAETLQVVWPNNLTIWPTLLSHKERNHTMILLKDEIANIKSISLIDLDKQDYNTTLPSLKDKVYPEDQPFIRFRKWRCSEIENYLLVKPAMARIAGYKEDTVEEFFVSHGIAYPELNKFIQSDVDACTKPLFESNGKEIIMSFCHEKLFDKFALAREIRANEICEDIKTILSEITTMCSQN